MRKLISIFLVVLLAAVCGAPLLAEDDGAVIFQKLDNTFFPEKAKFRFRMEDYENNRFKRLYVSECYIKGTDRYLLVGIEPAVFKGTVQLRLADTIFYYLKKIDKINQISAKVAFCNSTLTQEDVMNSKLLNFYNLESHSKVQLDGKDVYMFTLTAKSKEVAYNKIITYLDAKSYLLIKREYFSLSGQKIKVMQVDDIQMKNDQWITLKFTMNDTLRKGYFTKVTMSDFNYENPIPDTYFTKTYMKVAAK